MPSEHRALPPSLVDAPLDPLRDLRRRAAFVAPLLRPRRALETTRLWAGAAAARRRYRVLGERALRESRRSDTAFVLGSGKSILELTPEQWARVGEHDTISFSQFVRQRFVRADYHVIGEANDVEGYGRTIHDNPLYAETVFVVQSGWIATAANELLARALLPAGARVFFYRRRARGAYEPPSESFRRGLVHGWNSSTSVANFALLAGWRRIVLAGVDFYDREYFWLPHGVAREDEEEWLDVRSRFPNAAETVALFARWRALVEAQGRSLEVLNPRSLLAEALPVFRWESI